MRAILLTLLLSIMLSLSVKAADKNENANGLELTRAAVMSSIDDVTRVLARDYIYPEKAALVVNHLKRHAVMNDLADEKSWEAFAQKLGLLMRGISGDGYLDINTKETDFTLGHAHPTSHQVTTQRWGFEQIKVLSGNIGYFKLNHFYHHKEAIIQADNVFGALSHTDAMIIDLREAEGESIRLAQHMMSYFVEPETLLSHVVYQQEENNQALSVIDNIKSPYRNKNYPVYLLTSSFVSGTGEWFSYTLKQLNRAVIVGEKTMGVATLVQTQHINEQLNMTLPIALHINPVTKTNWEDEGVIPDHEIDAKQSVNAAYNLAVKWLANGK